MGLVVIVGPTGEVELGLTSSPKASPSPGWEARLHLSCESFYDHLSMVVENNASLGTETPIFEATLSWVALQLLV